MTRIVDADELREFYIERNNFDTYNDYSFALDTLDYMPTVEAIPIEWIKEWVTKYPELVSETTFVWMFEDWRKEQEKENEKAEI